MMGWKVLFWFSLLVIGYSYLGYGILMFLLVRLKRVFSKPGLVAPPDSGFEPTVSLVVAAYNEEEFIEKKIANTFALEYNPAKLKVIFITDGSTDATPSIIRRFDQIKLLHQAERKGKVAAMNRAMEFVDTDIVIFSDANTLLNPGCVKEIVKHYVDPKVGGVAGEKKIISSSEDLASAAGEGLYWLYESFLKKMDSDFYSVVGAAGELFSVRTALFEKAPENTIIEDFVQSLRICAKGYAIRYEPAAFAIESPSASMQEEQKRKIRICAGAFQAMVMLKSLFNVFKYPALSFQFISHRILRWTLCPLCLIGLLLSNAMILIRGWNPLYGLILVLQGVFYLLALIGWYFANRNLSVKALYVPYYFLFMNVAVFGGFYRFIRKSQAVTWEKAGRQKMR
jgi:poly-beta-1,6-N-acetyl-D-glucosamine synthase